MPILKCSCDWSGIRPSNPDCDWRVLLHSCRVSRVPAGTSLVFLRMFQFHVEECLLCPRTVPACFSSGAGWSRAEGHPLPLQWNIYHVSGYPGSQFEIYIMKKTGKRYSRESAWQSLLLSHSAGTHHDKINTLSQNPSVKFK